MIGNYGLIINSDVFGFDNIDVVNIIPILCFEKWLYVLNKMSNVELIFI